MPEPSHTLRFPKHRSHSGSVAGRLKRPQITQRITPIAVLAYQVTALGGSTTPVQSEFDPAELFCLNITGVAVSSIAEYRARRSLISYAPSTLALCLAIVA